MPASQMSTVTGHYRAARYLKDLLVATSQYAYPTLLKFSKHLALPLSVVVIVLVIVQRLIVADAEIDWDEELYFQIGHFWKYGLVPYRDIFDHKPPMVYLFYMMTSWGNRLFGVRIAVALMLIASVVFMFKAIQRAGITTRQQSLIMIPALLSLMSFGKASGTNTEMIYAPLIMLSFGLLLDEKLVLSALCAALALAVKYTIVIDLAGFGITYCWVATSRTKRIENILRWCALVLVSSVSIYTIFYIYFHYRGVDLFEEIVLRNIKHASSSEVSIFDDGRGFNRFALMVIETTLLVALLLRFRVENWRLLSAALLWLALAVVQGCITRQYYFHYFIPGFIPLVIVWSSMRFTTENGVLPKYAKPGIFTAAPAPPGELLFAKSTGCRAN